MKRLVVLLSLAVSSYASFGQEADDERRLRAIHAGLDTALVKGDVAYFESVFAPEYVFSHHFGRLVNRADNLDYLRTLSGDADYRVVRAASDEVQVRVSGDAAWVTAAWTTAIARISGGSLPGYRPPSVSSPQGAPSASASWNPTAITVRMR